MNAKNIAAERELIEQRNLGASLLGRIQELKRGMQEESNRLAQVTARQVQRLRLPHEHPTTKTHLYVIVRYGLAYPLYLFRQGEAERNTTALRWEQENANTRRIDPVPGSGINPETGLAALAQFLRSLPSDKVYLVFQVYEDSFAAFNTVKEATVKQGVEYTWEPRRNNAVLRLGATELPPPPQSHETILLPLRTAMERGRTQRRTDVHVPGLRRAKQSSRRLVRCRPPARA